MNRYFLMGVFVLLCGQMAWGQDENDIFFTAKTDEGIEVTYRIPAWSSGGYCYVSGTLQEGMSYGTAISTSTKGSLTIPKEVLYNGNRYGVTHIESCAFMNCTELTEVTLPESVVGIFMDAFCNCRKLKSITLPEKVSSDYFWTSEESFYVGRSAFSSCTRLEEITLPEGTQELSESAFDNCYSLKSITLPSTLKNIGSSTFASCEAMTSITIKAATPPTLEDTNVFESCSGATLYVPAGSKEDYAAADGWNQLASIQEFTPSYQDGDTFYAKNDDGVRIAYKVISTAENTCQVGDGNAAAIAQEYTGDVNIPALANGFRVQAVGDYAFSNCNASAITLPDGIKTIGNWVFLNCHRITTLSLPIGVTDIGWNAIESCSKLEALFWPSTITSRGLPTVSNCPALSRIESDDMPYGDCNAVISRGSVELGCKTTVIPDGIITIGSYAFYSCTGLTSVSLPNSVKVIGSNAFERCNGLTSIILPEQVSRIEWSAFDCSNLQEVTAMMTTPATIYSNTFSNRSNATLYVPAGCKAAYEAANYWKEFKEIVELGKEPIAVTDITTLTDAVYASAATALKGSGGTLTVCLKNVQPTNAYSFDLVLPEGVTVEGYTLSSRHDGHVGTMNYNEAKGAYSFAALSL